MRDTIVLCKNRDIVVRVFRDEAILLPIYRDSSKPSYIYSLNASAVKIWNMFDGKKTIAQIKKQLLKVSSSTSKEINKEMAGFIKDLCDIKALE